MDAAPSWEVMVVVLPSEHLFFLFLLFSLGFFFVWGTLLISVAPPCPWNLYSRHVKDEFLVSISSRISFPWWLITFTVQVSFDQYISFAHCHVFAVIFVPIQEKSTFHLFSVLHTTVPILRLRLC